MNFELIICEDKNALAHEAATRFVAAAEESIAARGRFRVALSGGSTPQVLYSLLSEPAWRERIAWNKTHVFWGDERNVPLDHADSNYRMARESLLAKVPIPEANVHRIKGELESTDAAREYEDELRREFGLESNQLPNFDLVLLGMGADGHTASLFPGTDVLRVTDKLVASVWVEKLQTHRVTLTLPVLCVSHRALFLVAGADKAETLREVLAGGLDEPTDTRYPSQLVRPITGSLVWLLDKAAASLLP